MRSSKRGAIPDENGWLFDTLDDFKRRLRTLESPSGEARNSVIERLARQQAELRELVENLEARMDAYLATDAPALIAAEVTAQLNALFAGDIYIGGGLTVVGPVTVPGARSTDVSGESNRVNAWIAGDGKLGFT